jgi:hypothetical protein
MNATDTQDTQAVALYWDFENLHASLSEAKYGEGSYAKPDARFKVQDPPWSMARRPISPTSCRPARYCMGMSRPPSAMRATVACIKRDEAKRPRWHVAMHPGKRRELDLTPK